MSCDTKAFRIVVVPSAAAGASTITKTLPKLMVLDVPREHKLDGTMGENAGPYDTAKDVIERVFNAKSMMGGHGKHVVKPDPEEFISNVETRNKEEKEIMCTRDLANLQPLYTKVNKPEGRICRYFFKNDNTANIERFPLFATHWIVLWMERSYSIPTPRIDKQRRDLRRSKDKEDIRPRNSCIGTLLSQWTTYRSPFQRPFESGFGTCKKASNHRRSLPIFSLTLFQKSVSEMR